MKKILYLVLLFVIVIYAAGCMGTYYPQLKYRVKHEAIQQNGISVIVFPIQDGRGTDSGDVGDAHSAFIKDADVVIKSDIAEWVTDSLREELVTSGYNLVSDSPQYKIMGAVEKVQCGSKINYYSDIILSIKITKGDKVVLEKSYTGKASEICWSEYESGYSTNLENALRNALEQIVNDLNSIALS